MIIAYRAAAACASLLAIGACELLTTNPPTLAGQYELSALDGHPLSLCCNSAADSGRIVAGLLTLGVGAEGGTYTWRMSRAHVYGSTTRIEEFDFAGGTYTRDGSKLTLLDSTGRGTMRGDIDDALTIRTDDHEYRFVQWTRDVVGQYMLSECSQAGATAGGCVSGSVGETVVAVIGGGLHIGMNDDNPDAYKWWLRYRYGQPDGTSEEDQSMLSTGTYTWDAATGTLGLVDASGDMAISADFSAFGLTLSAEGRRYVFVKLVSLPH